MWHLTSKPRRVVVLPMLGDTASYVACNTASASHIKDYGLARAPQGRAKARSRVLSLLALGLPVLLFAGIASAQYGQHPLLDAAADKVIQKYQNSSCEQLQQQRGQPKSQRDQEAVNFLRNDPQMRAMFIDKVAAPIANKLFECGMIP